MKWNSLYIVIVLALFGSITAIAQVDKDLCEYVDPTIGSEGLGRVFIGPSMPFGMVKPGPDCTCAPNSGWLPMPEVVTGFSQLHVSGTGGGPKYGNILIQPFTGDFNSIVQNSHREYEKVELGYYETRFKENGIKTKITTSNRVSFYQFEYSSTKNRNLLIDAGFFLGENAVPDAREAQQFVGSEIEIVSDKEIRGYSRLRGGWNNGRAYTVYFYAISDTPFTRTATWKAYPQELFNTKDYKKFIDLKAKSQFDDGRKTGALVTFDSADNDNSVKIKVGISFISSLKAKNNIDMDVPDWNLDNTLSNLHKQWNKLLYKIELDKSISLKQKRMFYTGIYHALIQPVDRTGENPLWTDYGIPYYDDFYAIWDTYRTSTPLITLLDPKRETDIVNSLINIYKRDGYMPDARSGNSNGRTQGGSNADVVIADAFVKGLNGIDYDEALRAMLKDATVPPGGNEEQEGRGGLVEYNKLGYIPYGIDRAGNRTVEYSYNDYNIAVLAKGLGKVDLYNEYIKKSDNWKNLWRGEYEYDGVNGFIMPRSEKGEWLDSVPFGKSKVQKPTFLYTPITNESPWYSPWWGTFFYEGISWEYSLSVPHDVAGLIEKCGGKDAFKYRLDKFFDSGYYNVNNEPSFLTPCLYHWIGRPDISGERIKEIIDKSYSDAPDGLPGNDDSGAMSSWMAFHLLGLYPNAGQSYYLLHAPLISGYTIHLSNGKTLRVTANGLSENNRYIKKIILNGKSWNKSWIEHSKLMDGGEMVFVMTDKPSKWGFDATPPSK